MSGDTGVAVSLRLEGAGGNAIAAARHGPWPNRDFVILLHGGGQTRHAWRKAARELSAAGFTAFSLDQRGHGDSAWVDDGAYAFADFAADIGVIAGRLAEEADALPVLVGASLGGFASMLALGEGLCAARGLVLVDVTPKVDPDGVARVRGFMAEQAAVGFASLEEAAATIARYLPHRPRPASLEGLRKNLRHGGDGRWRWHWDPRMLGAERFDDGARQILEARVEAAASRITAPVLLVRGARSELVGPAETAHFLSVVPRARFVDVSGARHMVAGDANDAFNAAVLSFMHELHAETPVI